MGKLDGRVALITGAARGQGRNHAIRMAIEGARVVAIDLCDQIESVAYPMSSPADLQKTAAAVQDAGGEILAYEADTRDVDRLREIVDEATERFSGIDIVVANAAIAPMSVRPHPSEWQDALDVNLTGTYNAVNAALPGMIERGRGGAIVTISSLAGITGEGGNSPGMLAYTASKHGVVGLTKAWANYLAEHHIRVNCIAPAGVNTPMATNQSIADYARAHPEFGAVGNALPGIAVVEVDDITNAVLFLASDEARYVTGVVLPVDAGSANKRGGGGTPPAP
jgi:SDR family mycofactocin-dependent oxidoreductase